MAEATAQRTSLVGFVDRYLDALAANDPSRLPAADGVRFTENAVELPLGKGLWATATGVPDFHYAYVEDEELGQIGWFGVVEESGRPAVVYLRLKVENGAISEIETIVRREQPQ